MNHVSQAKKDDNSSLNKRLISAAKRRKIDINGKQMSLYEFSLNISKNNIKIVCRNSDVRRIDRTLNINYQTLIIKVEDAIHRILISKEDYDIIQALTYGQKRVGSFKAIRHSIRVRAFGGIQRKVKPSKPKKSKKNKKGEDKK